MGGENTERNQGRRLFILGVAIVSLTLAPSVFIQQSVGDPSPEEPNDWVPFTTFDKGWWSFYGYDDYTFHGEYIVIKNQTAWASFWFNHTKGITPQPPVPTNISWDEEMVLVSLLGFWPNCCVARTNFTSAYLDGDTLYAYVQNIYGDGMLMAITNPYHIIVLQKADNVAFVWVNEGWDVYPPEGSIVINDGDIWTNRSSVTLTLTYYDYFSGVSQVRYSNDDIWDDELWESPSPTRAWTLEIGDGSKTVYYQVMDFVGWISNTYSDSVRLDTTPPSALIAFPREGQTFNVAEISVFGSASDNSGVGRVDVRVNGGPWQAATGTLSWFAEVGLLPGSNRIEVRALDMACNPSPIAYLYVTYTPIHPEPPMITESFLSGIGSENVTVIWSLSTDDGSGLGSVVRYDIYRGNVFSRDGSGYGLIASLPNGTSLFVDALRGEGDPNNYFYQVCAVDINGNVTCGTNQAGKFTRPLAKGPNLISVPLAQSSESIKEVLHTVRYDKAWYYDSVSQQWKSHVKHKTYRGDLWEADHTMALWVDATEDSNLTVAGIAPSVTMMHLHKGWNLVGFPSFNPSYSVLSLEVDTGAVRVEGYDPAPPYYLRVMGNAEVLQAGYGYWVRVEADTIWTVSA